MAELTAEDILQLIQNVMDSNKEANKEMISSLAFQIAHPAPTEKEMIAQKNLLDARIESALIESEAKKRRRIYCTGQSDKPHRRPNDPIFQGAFAGHSLIHWHLTQFSSRHPETKQLQLSEPIPIGICQWCHSEFKPGDEDYAEALSWGVNTKLSTAPMNVHTGDFVEMVEQR